MTARNQWSQGTCPSILGKLKWAGGLAYLSTVGCCWQEYVLNLHLSSQESTGTSLVLQISFGDSKVYCPWGVCPPNCILHLCFLSYHPRTTPDMAEVPWKKGIKCKQTIACWPVGACMVPHQFPAKFWWTDMLSCGADQHTTCCIHSSHHDPDKQVSSWRHISCHTDKNRYYT